MKRYIRSSEDLSSNQKIQLRKELNRIIFWMWNDGDKMNIGGEGSTRARTLEDYKNSDYSSLSKYVMDHKQDIFDRDEIMKRIDSYADSKKNSEAIRQKMIQEFDNYSEADFTRNLYLRREDTKKKGSKK